MELKYFEYPILLKNSSCFSLEYKYPVTAQAATTMNVIDDCENYLYLDILSFKYGLTRWGWRRINNTESSLRL